MLESILASALVEQLAIPAAGAFLASEAIGLSKKTKSNSLLQLVFRIVKAVARELVTEDNANPAEAQPSIIEPEKPKPKPAPRKRTTTTRRRTSTK